MQIIPIPYATVRQFNSTNIPKTLVTLKQVIYKMYLWGINSLFLQECWLYRAAGWRKGESFGSRSWWEAWRPQQPGILWMQVQGGHHSLCLQDNKTKQTVSGLKRNHEQWRHQANCEYETWYQGSPEECRFFCLSLHDKERGLILVRLLSRWIKGEMCLS